MKLGKLSKNKKVFIILSFIVILGFVLRVYHLAGPSLWHDELRTADRIRCQPAQIIASLYKAPFPPLYFITMHYWTKFLGDSEFSLRFPSVIFSVASIIFIFILSKELFGAGAGLFAAFFASISPYSIYYAQEAKMYSMLWLFGLLSFLFFHRFNKDNGTPSLLPYIIFTLIAVYTMYIGFIFMIIQNIVFFSLPRRKIINKWLAAQLAIILLYLPWLGRFLYHINHKTGIEWIPAVSGYPLLFRGIFSRVLTGMLTQNNYIEGGIYFLFMITAFVNMNITNSGKKIYMPDFKRNDLFLVLWIIIPLAVYCLINKFACPILYLSTERYVGFIYIPLLILIGKGINKYSTGVKSIMLIFLLVTTISFRILPLYAYNYRLIRHDNFREFSRQLQLRANTDSLLLTELPLYVAGYYNKGYEIRPLDRINLFKNEAADKGPSSIFIIYRADRSMDTGSSAEIQYYKNKLKAYNFIEHYYQYPNGFLWFKKLQ